MTKLNAYIEFRYMRNNVRKFATYARTEDGSVWIKRNGIRWVSEKFTQSINEKSYNGMDWITDQEKVEDFSKYFSLPKPQRKRLESAERKNKTDLIKNKLVLENIIFKYSPDYKHKKSQEPNRKDPLRCHIDYELEKLMSECSNGLHTHTPVYGRDHSDDSDTKCCAIGSKFDPSSPNTSFAAIQNVRAKQGALRAIIVDVLNMKIRYYFLPYEVWKKMENNAGEIKFAMHVPTQRIKRFEDYECSSFLELAKMSDISRVLKHETFEEPESTYKHNTLLEFLV